jgi:hypothetical protein
MDPHSESEERVSSYLEGLEQGEKQARRSRLVTLGAGLALAAVGILTSIGVVPTEARELVAGAGVVVVGFAMSRS